MAARATAPPRRPLLVSVGEILWDLLPDGRQLGGAPANVAWHAACLGLRASIVSAVGDDADGHEILDRLDRMGIDRSHVAVDPQHRTGTAAVALDAEGRSTFAIAEQAAWDHVELHAGLMHLAVEADAVCVGTLAQRGETSRRCVQAFLGATRAGCLRVFDVNLRQDHWHQAVLARTIALSDIVKVNDEEWPVVARLLEVPAEVRAGSLALRRRHGLRLVAITRGAAGSLLCHADGIDDHPGIPCRVVDTVGAGDAFTAALAAGWLHGLPIERIHDLAARCASYVCSRAGATPRLPAELALPVDRPARGRTALAGRRP
jgi:fructokinase